jgi:hypothetical protein
VLYFGSFTYALAREQCLLEISQIFTDFAFSSLLFAVHLFPSQLHTAHMTFNTFRPSSFIQRCSLEQIHQILTIFSIAEPSNEFKLIAASDRLRNHVSAVLHCIFEHKNVELHFTNLHLLRCIMQLGFTLDV